MLVMLASLPCLEGVLVHQPAGVMEGGGGQTGGLVVGGLKTHTSHPSSAIDNYRSWMTEGGDGGGCWRKTNLSAILQCLSSQLVTLKHQSRVIISNCWRNRTQGFGPLSRFSSALMGEREEQKLEREERETGSSAGDGWAPSFRTELMGFCVMFKPVCLEPKP